LFEDDELNAPKFSTAISWKIRLIGKLLYFINFFSAANFTNITTPVAALSTYDCASVLTTVTSQASDFQPCHVIKVSPSGRLPSCLTILMAPWWLSFLYPWMYSSQGLKAIKQGCYGYWSIN